MACEDRGRQTTDQERANYIHEQKVWEYKREEVKRLGLPEREGRTLSAEDQRRITKIIGLTPGADPDRALIHTEIVESVQQLFGADAKETEALQERLNNVTRMLCSIMKSVENGNNAHVKHIEGLEEWWEEHKEGDAEEKARLRALALSKLTPLEKQALGIEE